MTDFDRKLIEKADTTEARAKLTEIRRLLYDHVQETL